MDNSFFSNTYQKIKLRPLAAIRVRAAAGDPRRGWLTAGPQTIPVALGRGGIIANKREGDGGTPTGIFRPRQRGIPASGARRFFADRRMRIDDKIGDVAPLAANRSADKDHHRLSYREAGCSPAIKSRPPPGN